MRQSIRAISLAGGLEVRSPVEGIRSLGMRRDCQERRMELRQLDRWSRSEGEQ